VAPRLRARAEECQVAGIVPRQRVGGGGGRRGGADRGDRRRVEDRQRLAVSDPEQHHHALVRVVRRAVVAGHDRNDLEAEALWRAEVARHEPEQARAVGQAQHAAQRLHGLAPGQRGERLAHEADADLHG
jgi:hypothetical protein